MNREPSIRRPDSAFLTFGLVTTLTFDIFTSKSNQFVFGNKCIEIVSLEKLPKTVCKIGCRTDWLIE